MKKKFTAIIICVIMLFACMVAYADGGVEITSPKKGDIMEYGAVTTMFTAPEGDSVSVYIDGEKATTLTSIGSDEYTTEEPLAVGEHTVLVSSLGSANAVCERVFKVEYNSAGGYDKGVRDIAYITEEGNVDYVLNDELSAETDTLILGFDSTLMDISKAKVSVKCDGVELPSSCSKNENGEAVIKFNSKLPLQGKLEIEIDAGAYKVEKRIDIKASKAYMTALHCEGVSGRVISNDALKCADTVTPSVVYVNSNAESVDAAVIFALFEGNKIIEIGTKNVVLEGGADNKEISLSPVTMPTEGENFRLEAYLIDSFLSRGVLCDAVTLNPSNEAPYEMRERVYLNTLNHVSAGTYIVGTNENEVNTDSARFYEKNGVKVSLLHEGGNPADGTNNGQFVLTNNKKSIKFQTTSATSNGSNSRMFLKFDQGKNDFYGSVMFLEMDVVAVGSRSYIHLYNNNEYLRTILNANGSGTWARKFRVEVDSTDAVKTGGNEAVVRYYENGAKIVEFKRTMYSGDITFMFAGYKESNTVIENVRFGQIK